MTGYRLHEALLAIVLFGMLCFGVGIRSCQDAHVLRIQRMELARFHEELRAAYGDAPTAAGEMPSRPVPAGYELLPAPPGAPASMLVDLNTADERVLQSLPGIGPERARDIIETRLRVGGFETVDDLDMVPGIGAATVDRLRSRAIVRPRPGSSADGPAPADVATATAAPPQPIVPLVTTHPDLVPIPTPAATPLRPYILSPPPAPRTTRAPTPPASRAPSQEAVNINTAGVEDLSRLAGIGDAKARAIIRHRMTHGPFRSADDLAAVPGIGEKTIARNRHLIVVR